MGELISFPGQGDRPVGPRQTAELDGVTPGQAVPIIRRAQGVFGQAIRGAEDSTGFETSLDTHGGEGHWRVVALDDEDEEWHPSEGPGLRAVDEDEL